MENKIEVFQNEQFGAVRITLIDGEPWFAASDVCKALEIKNAPQALSRLEEDERFTTIISNDSAASGKSKLSFVNEAGLYSLILSSRKPEAKVFGQRVADAAEEIIQENERACQEVGMNEELTTNSCKPISYEDSIENKVVVVKGSILRPEFRHANHQLMLCTGGFGAQANARGRTCYCISLYDGRKTSFYRTDFLGVMDEKKLPEWAQKGLEKAKEMHAQEKKPAKERGDAR